MPRFTGEKNRFKSRVNDQLNPPPFQPLSSQEQQAPFYALSASSSRVSLGWGHRSQHYRGRPGSSSRSHTHTAAQRGRPWLPCPRGSLTQQRPRTPLLPPEPFS